MARATRFFGLTLALLGVLPLLYALGLLAWQCLTWLLGEGWVALPARVLLDHSMLHGPIAGFIPGIDWAWLGQPHSQLGLRVAVFLLDHLHVGIVFALLGFAIIRLGSGIAARQAEVLEWQARQHAERRRRVAQYQSA